MINNIYVGMLAMKIFNKEINPKTGLEFNIEDVKIEEYKFYVLEEIKKLESD